MPALPAVEPLPPLPPPPVPPEACVGVLESDPPPPPPIDVLVPNDELLPKEKIEPVVETPVIIKKDGKEKE